MHHALTLEHSAMILRMGQEGEEVLRTDGTWQALCKGGTGFAKLSGTYTYMMINKTIKVNYPEKTYDHAVHVDFSEIAGAGYGLFASQDIMPKTIVAIFDRGEVLDQTVFFSTRGYSEYAMTVKGSRLIVDEAENRSLAAFANHNSSSPNTVLEFNTTTNNFHLKCLRSKITKGQEITFDYTSAFWEARAMAMCAFEVHKTNTSAAGIARCADELGLHLVCNHCRKRTRDEDHGCTKKSKYVCTKCDESFSTQALYFKHLRQHTMGNFK